ncbi:MAG TPA: AMP-binding protein [Acidimicrobiia bacterium]|nr:AMP-binding protein [Acidimicrobiia bacterium]
MPSQFAGETLQRRFEERLAKDPGGRALAWYEPGSPVEWLSFEQFYGQAKTIASNLVDRGLRAGDTCVIVLPSGELAAKTLMAVLVAGARPLLMAPPALLGMNSDLPRILRSTVARSEAKMVMLPASLRDDRDVLEAADDSLIRVYCDDDLEGDGSLPEAGELTSNDIAALQLTSGTTGLPKICVWTQRAVLAALDGMAAAMGLTPNDVCFNWTPLYHDMGLVNNFLTCMSTGSPLVMMDPHAFVKRPIDWMRGLQETGATVTWSPNFGFALLAQRTSARHLEGLDLSHVRGFWNAAERIHARTYAHFLEVFSEAGVRAETLKTNFGCAENIGGATFTPEGEAYVVEHVDPMQFRAEGVAVPVGPDHPDALPIVGAGKGHPWLEVVILDDHDSPVSDGIVGAVALETPSRMEGYLNDPEATSEAFAGNLLKTGDLGYVRDGELFWTGRVQERITVRGKKIDPSDLEPILFDIPGVRQGRFAAFGVDDAEEGTQAVVIVTELVEDREVDPDEVAALVRKEITTRIGVGVADVVIVTPGTLTKTSSGKRRHRHFREKYESGALQDFMLTRAT